MVSVSPFLVNKSVAFPFTGKKSCADFYKSGQRKSGVYKIKPDSLGSFDVFCDQKTAGGGWTVIQKRLDGSVKFLNRGWKDYKSGFGNLNGEFWLGLDKMHRLTKTKNKLRVELQDWKGNSAYAEYSLFAVSSEQNKYKLSLGSYSGKFWAVAVLKNNNSQPYLEYLELLYMKLLPSSIRFVCSGSGSCNK